MTQADIADFATWIDPATSFQVHYSLPVFHEIDFAVTEGYRRIPHGGIEVGGLLFGRRFPDAIRIEAFRLIDCEHAQGPSFKLSERDVATLREQIAKAPTDPELGGLEPLGWFIAHTRGPLEMTDQEVQLFNDLLPGPGMVTVLVKPEKFKPTLFTFLPRGWDGNLRSKGSEQAVILPLPGRAGKAGEAAVPPPPPVSEATPPRPVPVEPIREAPEPEPAPSVPPEPPRTPAPRPQWQFDEMPAEQPPPLFGDYGQATAGSVHWDAPRQGSQTGRVLMMILIAAVLGLGAAFWFYQQMPPGIIQLTVEPQRNGVVVSWPPEQTSEASRAFIRVNDGPEIDLTPEAKTSGRYQVQSAADNLKVEIVAEHPLHNSRGIVRYIQPTVTAQ